MTTAFAKEIVQRCCDIHFKEINPSDVVVSVMRPGKGDRRIAGFRVKEGGKITLQIDEKFMEKTDPITLTEEIAHELAHIKLKHDKRSAKNETAANEEVKAFFRKIKENDKRLMKEF
jgi:hypothetical protein